MCLNKIVFWIFFCIISIVFARQDVYESKCTRKCDTAKGTLDCWRATTDGFTYGVSAAMVDFCKVVLKLRNLTDPETWRQNSLTILNNQIDNYEIDDGVQQVSRDDMKLVAASLLDSCFNTSATITSTEPICSSCSNEQETHMKQWKISSIVIISIAGFLAILLLLLYFLQSSRLSRTYVSL